MLNEVANYSCQVLIRRLSHIIDLDVDDVCNSVVPLCNNPSDGESCSGRSESSDPVRAEVPASDTSASRVGRVMVLPSHPPQNDQPPPAYRSRSTPVALHSVNVPGYQQMHYSAPTPIWDSSAGTPSAGQTQYFTSQSLPYSMPPPPPPTRTEGTEQYGSAQMEVPYTQGFAWPFSLEGDNIGGRHPSGREPQPGPMNPLTEQDIAAFMRINPGEEPFL